MSTYTFTNTEKTKGKASDYETYSALYMIGFHKDKDKIDYILVDCFNDVSCVDKGVNRIYDIQSKGYAKCSPKQAGAFLYTLYKNYQKDYPFVEYILFLETFDSKKLAKKIFKINDLLSDEYEDVKRGLVDEINRRDGFDDMSVLEHKVNEFLPVAKFVVCNFSKVESIKSLIPLKNIDIKDDEFYIKIFNEIRGVQTALKNINIENQAISNPNEVLKFHKYIEKRDISILLINSIIGTELFKNKNIPINYLPEIAKYQPEEVQDIILNCNAELSMLFFNKNNKKNIWQLLVDIINLTQNNSRKSVSEIYMDIPKTTISKVTSLNDMTIKYFIARIQEGLK